MNLPKDEAVDPSQLKPLALGVIAADRFPILATLDGDQPRVRPVSPIRTDGFTVYVANLKQYRKTKEIETNPKVELCYMDKGHNQVRISGMAEILKDRKIIQELWDASPLLRQYLGSIDNPDLVIYRITPREVKYMREWALNYHVVPLDG